MPGTRSQGLEDTAPTCHVLNYLYDDDNGMALTALVHTLRFHIMIDPDRLESKEVKDHYLRLLDIVRRKDEPEGANKKRKRDDNSEQDQADSGYGSSPVSGPPSRSSTSKRSVTLAKDDREDNEAVTELQNWVLEPFGDVFASLAPADEEKKQKTVHDWFHGSTFYHFLICDKSGTLTTEEAQPIQELQDRVSELIPSLQLPKYITSYKIPIFSTADLNIIETSDSPSPRHPAIVTSSATGETYFLKLVDPTQPNPTKRELKMMKDIEAKGIHEKIRVPLVQGVVVDSTAKLPSATSNDRTTKILGFLMTHIPSATPLTTTLDEDFAESKRERWAKEVERYIKVLHDEGFVWGDAKADNFMIDKDAKLWIIDFGGSYTEGWIDPELNETIEGDNMGAEKIVQAVRDPEGFTFDPDEDAGLKEKTSHKEEAAEDETRSQKKRKVEEDVPAGDSGEAKVQSDGGGKDAATEGEEKTYCYCNKAEAGRMVGCDGQDCEREWFHVECTDLQEMPGEKEKWFCNNCRDSA